MRGASYSRLAGLIESVIRSKALDEDDEQYDRVMRKVISCRLDAADIYQLESIAKEMGLARSACMEQLLQIAIHEVADGLGIRHFITNSSGDEQGRVTVSADGKPSIVVEDDALIIAGGDDR